VFISDYYTRDCQILVESICARHKLVSEYLKTFYKKYKRAYGYKKANLKIREIDKQLFFSVGVSCTLDDQQIIERALVCAKACEKLYASMRNNSDIFDIENAMSGLCVRRGVLFPVKFSKTDSDSKRAEKIICACLRVSDEKWWRRQLRVGMGRQVEKFLRESGFVQAKKGTPYVSKYALNRFKFSQARNRRTLEKMEAVTEFEGEEVAVSLTDCIDASVSNPENMRNELMVRMRGYEEIAQSMGFVGGFLTLTAPSRFHSAHKRGGMSSKFEGATPRDVVDYLNRVWARVRSAWQKKGIKTFGFRVAEPHHDGTPHYHFLLFFNAQDSKAAYEIFKEKALQDTPDEAGARENRCDIRGIDPSKGSAAAYIAKYVSKNLNGSGVGLDHEGECFGEDGAIAARAWASLWGIRQFQAIGSVSVTVWRELRRNRDVFDKSIPEHIELIRKAADEGEWCEFVRLMGGALVDRKDMVLRPLYFESETKQGVYAEHVKRLIGLSVKPLLNYLNVHIFTREKVWTIREKAVDCNRAAQPPTESVKPTT